MCLVFTQLFIWIDVVSDIVVSCILFTFILFVFRTWLSPPIGNWIHLASIRLCLLMFHNSHYVLMQKQSTEFLGAL